ncbi:low-density lipoprotein receptor-related protein 4-like [Copidosoma floridanum]|uniref:low-density lipoprotein receptor-related protein 4-like n=1 Tax=Copidosoma floridanum TaxID=29053 RepID=UPI000C6FC0E6|nr:low-density lipoprotein receptor-related protein 4-like [Copidosoma floridanum]
MAVDYVTDKLYFVDRSSGALGVIDLKSPKNFGLVFSDLEEPHDLVLDPAEGLMFVVLFYRSIMKANMDGSSLRTVVESPKVSAIAIDRKATRIYWANDQTSIESSDYDGTNRQMVIAIPMSVISLTTTDNQLFWTRAANWSDMCPCSNALWTCALYRRTCNNVTFHKLPFDSPRLLRTSFDQRRHLVKNPCAGESNGGCEQLCLMTAEGSHGCACNVGWTLNADGKTCSGVSKLLVYAQGEHFRARILGMERNESFAAAVVPTRFRVGRMNKKTSVHFDYDMVSGELYFSDDLSIYRINLLKEPAGEEEETEEQTVVLSVSEAYAIKDVVYDWSKNGILYIKQSQDGSSNHSLVMHSFKLDVKAEKTVLTSKFKKEAYIDCPHNLAIQPNHEYLFFSDYNGVNDNLRRVSSNGKGLILWKPFYSNVQLIFLAIDSERSRLYWSTSVSASMIKSANLEGSEEETVQVLSVANLLYAGVKDQWLYVGNHTEIWAVKRDNGADPVRLVKRRLQQQKTGRYTTYEFIHGLRIYSLAARNVT